MRNTSIAKSFGAQLLAGIVVVGSLIGMPVIGAKGPSRPVAADSVKNTPPAFRASRASTALRVAPNATPAGVEKTRHVPEDSGFGSLEHANEGTTPSRELLGRTNFKLSGPMTAGGDAYQARFSPDGTTVVYMADQDTDEIFELYSVPIDGSTMPIKISGAMLMGPGSGVLDLTISPVP